MGYRLQAEKIENGRTVSALSCRFCVYSFFFTLRQSQFSVIPPKSTLFFVKKHKNSIKNMFTITCKKSHKNPTAKTYIYQIQILRRIAIVQQTKITHCHGSEITGRKPL